MTRKTRLVLTFALAILLPAGVLAFLGFRAIRAEEIVRRAEADDQARAFVRLAAGEIRADLEAWLTENRNGPGVIRIVEAAEPADVDGAVAGERPDLVPLLAHAQALEFRETDPAAAMRIYAEMAAEVEHGPTRARLLARAARCAIKARDASARERLERLADETAMGESGVPIGTVARYQLLELGVEVPLPDAIDPAFELVMLQRLRGPRERVERATVALRALSDPPADPAWFGPWAAFREGGELRLLRAGDVPREPVRRRLEEIARLGYLKFDVRPAGASAAYEAPVVGGLRVVAEPAEARPAPRSSLLLAGLVALLVVAMSLGFVATVRAVDRELRLAQLKSDFVSNVSHELRTPLTSVRVFSELLGKVDEERRREYVDLIQRETARLSRMVERILDFARLERGQQVMSFDVCDLRETVGAAVRSFRPPRDFAVRFEPPAAPVRASVDAQALEQALHNLFDNAVKYAPEERKAEVTLGAEGDHARIEVRDRGTGIDPRDLPSLFEKFRRGSGPLTLQVPGTGLGLAMVRQIVEAHRGRVRVESAPGRGSTFIIEIPLWRES